MLALADLSQALEILDQQGALIHVGDAWDGHYRAGDSLLDVCQERVKLLGCPDDPRESHRRGICEPTKCARPPAYNAA